MKKILTHATGIALLIAILIAGACSSADDTERPSPEFRKVVIYLKIHVKDDGTKHLELYDSSNPSRCVINDLSSVVEPGTKVVWRRAKESGIKTIMEVAPVSPGEIFTEEAKSILLNLRYRTRVPNTKIDPGTQEKYIIVFVDNVDRDTTMIDPYLRIRGVSQDTLP